LKDFDAWKPAFDEHQAVREKHGGKGHRLYRTLDDPNSVVIVSEFETAEGANAFMADPSLPEAMDRGGVVMPPNVWPCDEMETRTY
jgi:heme-degrading monooxygenase HmoA